MTNDVVNIDNVHKELLDIEKKINNNEMEDKGWVGVLWKDVFLAIDGPMYHLEDRKGEYFDNSMQEELAKSGFETKWIKNDYGEVDFQRKYLKYCLVSITDRHSWIRRPIYNSYRDKLFVGRKKDDNNPADISLMKEVYLLVKSLFKSKENKDSSV